MTDNPAPARVVIVDPSTAMTGALKAAGNIALHASSFARVILVRPTAATGLPETHPFERVAHIPMKQIRRSLKDLALYVPFLLAGSWKLKRLLKREGATVVVLNDFYLMQGAVLRLLGFRGTIVSWVRVDPERFPRRLKRLWLNLTFRSADRVVAVSDFIVSRLDGRPEVLRIYDPIDGALGSPPAGDGVGRQDIVCVANYIEGKGQNHALEAFASIAEKYPEARLRFFGGDMGLEKNRQFRRALEARVDELALTQKVEFNSFATDLGAAHAGARLALVLSESETFSMTCLEACQLAVPVISFRSGGPQEIIVDGETGFLCDVGDVAAVADRIGRLLDSPQLAEQMGRDASALVRRKFAPSAFADQLRDLFVAPAGSPKSRSSAPASTR